jgi:hypothetical protein
LPKGKKRWLEKSSRGWLDLRLRLHKDNPFLAERNEPTGE